MHAEVYWQIREANPNASLKAEKMVKFHARRRIIEQWSRRLTSQRINQKTRRVVAAI